MINNYVAIYCRLSREDGNIESQSISSQKAALADYVNKQGWDIYDYYIDDGYSGTNFIRPEFKRMLEDIENNKVKIVLTKDLSRLGRNYIQTGYYTEEYFPLHHVRYIALNDGFDSFKEEENDLVPFKNIINEWYAKDISKKIRFTLDNKAKRGEPRNTVFPIFGYTYNEKFERIPDGETASIVKEIFKKYIETGSSTKVANYLRENKVKIPSYYNALKYHYNQKKVLQMKEEELYNWTPNKVRDILVRNDYLGTYTTSKTKSKNYKMKKRRINEHAYVFEERYEPLIDKETFAITQRLIKKTRAGLISIEENEYKGLIVCLDCGKTMKYERKRDCKTAKVNYIRYYCYNKNCDSGNTIKKKDLDEVINKLIIKIKDYILNNETKFIELIINKVNTKREFNLDIEKELAFYQTKVEERETLIINLFEENSQKIIPKAMYEKMMNKYIKEKELYEEQINTLKEKLKERNNNGKSENRAKEIIKLLKGLEKEKFLNYQIIQAFIYQIKIKAVHVMGCKRKYEYNIEIKLNKLDTISEKSFST